MSNTRTPFGAIGTGLNDDAKKAMNSAFDAMSEWRNEIASMADRNSNKVFDKMAEAAKAVGWPAEFVDMTRKQMQSGSKMQLHMMDQVMDAWEQQVKNPGAGLAGANAMMDQMKAFTQGMGNMPGFPAFGKGFPNFPGMPDMSNMQNMPMVPLQFWMQAADMWQKSWQQALQTWMEAQQNLMKGGR
jgi:hypothetical protein